MEREPVEVVRAAFEAFNEDGTEAFIEHIHPDVEFTTPADLASEPDTYRGHDGVRRYWDSFFEIMEEIKVEPLALQDWGERLVVAEMLVTVRGRVTGLQVSQRAHIVVTVADGKALGLSFHPTLDEAEAAAEAGGGKPPA